MEGEKFAHNPPIEKPEEKKKYTKMTIICAWCNKIMGEKEVESANEQETHSICDECKANLKKEIEEKKKQRSNEKNF